MDIKLSNDPIVEAVFEVRYENATGMPGSAVAGLLYSEFRSKYPKFEECPAANIPENIRNSDPNLQFAPTHKMSGESFGISVGDRVCVVFCRSPYMHWEEFKPRIIEAIARLNDIGVVKKVVRTGLRYINIIPCDGAPKDQFMNLKVSANLGGIDVCEHMASIRAEIIKNDFLNIISIASNGQAVDNESGDAIKGLVFDIDTICRGPFGEFMGDLDLLLERAHATEKDIFFSSLSEDALSRLR